MLSMVTRNCSHIYHHLFIDQYPTACDQECRCYANPHQMVLVADCAHAGLTQIPKSLPKDTDWLILSGNNITSFQIEDIKYFHNLLRLLLKNNKIKHISGDTMEYLYTKFNLADLDLSNNELKFLPRTFEKVTMKLSLIGNQFECKCNNIWIKNWLIDHRKMVQDYEEVVCYMVESGQRIPFVKLTDADLTCPSMFMVLIQINHLSDTSKMPFHVIMKPL